MKPIIVATDFSKPSVNAAHYAADLAKSIHADIILAHVIEIPVNAFQVPVTEMEVSAIENAARASLAGLQKELLERTKNKINVLVEIHYGSVNFEIEKIAYEKKPMAIAVGIKNHADISRFFSAAIPLGLFIIQFIPF